MLSLGLIVVMEISPSRRIIIAQTIEKTGGLIKKSTNIG